MSTSVSLSVRPNSPRSLMTLRLSPFRSVDALTLISVINWRDLLHSPSVIPSGLHRSPSSCPLLPFLSAHPFIKRWLSSHLHSLNQPPSTRPCDPVLFSSRLSLSPLLLPLRLLPSLSSTSAAVPSCCQYESLAHLIKSHLMAD